MAIRTVRVDGDPLLRKKSRTVEKLDDKIKQLIQDMKDTMLQREGVGIAAVQVGMLRKIIVVDPTDDDKMPILPFDYDGPFALINPTIIEMDGKEVLEEGCLSVPGVSGKVERPKHIKVQALDENFEKVEFDAYDYLARIICHEVDHTNGILFTDKVIPSTED